MATVTAKALRQIVADAPDDAILVVPGPDHSLRPANMMMTMALQEGPRQFTEDFGEELTPEAEFGKRVIVLIVK